jgi:hypothetical protein
MRTKYCGLIGWDAPQDRGGPCVYGAVLGVATVVEAGVVGAARRAQRLGRLVRRTRTRRGQ